MKKKMSVFLFLFLSVFLGLIMPKQVNAVTIYFPIDTTSKVTTQSSIVYIFDNFEDFTVVPELPASDLNAWKLFNFMKELYHYNNNISQSAIQAMLANYNINYTSTIVNQRYTVVQPWKEPYYVEDNSYLGKASFTDCYETVNFVFRVTEQTRGSRYIPELPSDPTPPYNKTYGPFLRYFNGNQSVYGYTSNYIPKITFNYSVGILFTTKFTLIDKDKLILQCGDNSVYIDRKFHYSRNNYQPNFPTNYSDFAQLYDAEEQSGNYFHKLALWNGDTSNSENKKYHVDPSDNILNVWPNSKWEVVYSANNLKETNSLVLGTFNFYTGIISISHYLYDVYPYLIWGNADNDSSVVRERICWDCDSFHFGSAYQYRGNALYQNYCGSLFIQESDLVKLEERLYQ